MVYENSALVTLLSSQIGLFSSSLGSEFSCDRGFQLRSNTVTESGNVQSLHSTQSMFC